MPLVLTQGERYESPLSRITCLHVTRSRLCSTKRKYPELSQRGDMSTSTSASAAPSLEDLLSGVHKKDAEESAAKPGKKSTAGKPLEITEEEENVGGYH